MTGKSLYIEMAGYGWPYSPTVRADQDAWNLELEVNTLADLLRKHKKVND
jgi:hypothetical protein